MARDRKRAKQRRARREQHGGRPTPARPRAEEPLDHASGEVDEFEARLAAGSADEPAPGGDPSELSADGPGDLDSLSDEDFDALEDDVDEVEQAIEVGDGRSIERAERAVGTGVERRRRGAASAGTATHRGPGRFVGFLRASWAELQRVQWPDRRQVAQATAVVLGFVIVAGLYLGLADKVSQEIVNLIV